MAIWRDIIDLIKYIKIFLVHPATEITLNIIYLLSIFIIGLMIFSDENYNELEILDMTESYLYYNNFKNIKTPSQFNAYLLSILDKLYTINPDIDEIPLFIPISPIRFVAFNNSNDCNTELDYSKNCRNDEQKFKCAIDNLSKAFKSQCGKKYSDGKGIFEHKLTGYYSSYSLRKAENYIDFTRDTYYSNYRNIINNMIDNKQLKAIIMRINLIAPSNKNYIDVILGLEMTNYFTDVKIIFSSFVFNEKRPKTNTLFFIFIIMSSISVFISVLKLVYEINVKCIWSVHIFYFLIEALDVVFIVIGLLYVFEDKNLEFKVNLKEFECHLKYITIIWYLKLFYSFLVIFYPFRVLGLISWWKRISEPFVLVLNALFRMLPGIIMTIILFCFIIFTIFFTNYFLFNDIFEFYETMFNSFISAFNIRILINFYNRTIPSKIFGNLFQSKYSAIIILFQICMIYFYFAIIIATLVYLYKKAVISLEPPKKNKYVKKLSEIEEKLEEQKMMEYSKDDLLKKQILWLTLDKKNQSDNYIISKYQVLLFKNSIQILSYLKYIFAIKPEMQFKKLLYKLNIVIEITQKKIGEKEMKEISNLAEWLIFVGSKIPIFIYGKLEFDRNLRMKLNNIYKLIYFINDDKFLEKIIETKGKKFLSISNDNNFTLNLSKNK